MNPVTAVLFILAGTALYFSSTHALSTRLSNASAVIVAIVALMRLVAYCLGWHTDIDKLLFAEKLLAVAHAPNRMAPNTAINFVLLGAALLALNSVSRWRPASLLARALALISMLSAGLALLGYVNGVATLYGFSSFIPMALHTAAAFVLLATAVLLRASQLDPISTSTRSVSAGALQRKIAAAFAVAIFMLIVISVIAYHSIHQFIANTEWDEHTRQVLLAIGDLGSELKDVETGTRGYVISGDEQYLEPFRISAVRVLPKLRELFVLTADNPSQQQRLHELENAATSKLSYSKEVIELRRSQGFDAASQRMLIGDGRRLMAQIREHLDAMRIEENDLLAARSGTQNTSASRTVVLICLGGVFSLGVILLAGWQIRRDIKARANAEAALRASEERFRGLVESAKEYAILFLDIEGRFQTWNPGAQRIMGYRAEEMIGEHFSRFYSADDIRHGKPAREMKEAIERGQYEEDGWRIRKDGSRFWANVVMTCLRDPAGEPIGFSKITRDLTERMRATEQTQNFFSLSLDLLCIAGINGFFKHLNPAWEETFGFTYAELRAKPYLDFVHPDDREATIASVRALAAGDVVINFENRYLCKDGSYRWLTWNAALSSDRELIYAAARDITEQKRSDDAIASLNASLQLGNTQLEAANKELEAFSYSVSHDLRAPLRGIDGFSQALLEDFGDRLDETGKDYLSRVRAGTQRMGQLIDDMLNLSRVTRSEMKVELVDLSVVASAVIAELQRAQPERKVEVIIPKGIVAFADPRLVRVMLDNLVGNAWKFTSKRSDARIEVGIHREGDDMEYFVRDNGAGFDMTYSNKLFGAFQRLHAATDFSGTGIGLATVQRIIHRHGGRIRAEGAVNQGAIFYFTLSATTKLLVDQAA